MVRLPSDQCAQGTQFLVPGSPGLGKFLGEYYGPSGSVANLFRRHARMESRHDEFLSHDVGLHYAQICNYGYRPLARKSQAHALAPAPGRRVLGRP